MREWNYENEQWTRLPSHLKHLPLFTRHLDMFSIAVRYIWALFLKHVFFKFYIFLRVKGDWKEIYNKYPKLLIISNHGSHLDAVSIAASIPTFYWIHLFIAAAKDYFFTNPLFTFFSQHCLGAIPIDRKDRKGEAIQLILTLLNTLERIWLIIFPEGTRSKDGKVQDFKRGVSLFAQKTNTPIAFVYVDGNNKLWPKNAIFARPGILTIHVGPVHPPAPIEVVYEAYRNWAIQIAPDAFESMQIPQVKESEDESSQAFQNTEEEQDESSSETDTKDR